MGSFCGLGCKIWYFCARPQERGFESRRSFQNYQGEGRDAMYEILVFALNLRWWWGVCDVEKVLSYRGFWHRSRFFPPKYGRAFAVRKSACQKNRMCYVETIMILYSLSARLSIQ